MGIPRFPKAPNNTVGTFANADVPSVDSFTVTQSTPSEASGYTISAGDSFSLIGDAGKALMENLQDGQEKKVTTVEAPDLDFNDDSGFVSKDRGLTNTQASNIGAGIQAGAQIAGGIAQGVQTSKLQDAAYMQGNDQLDSYAKEQRKNRGIDNRAQDDADANARFDRKIKSVAFRHQMFQRDLAKELEHYNDATSNLDVIQNLVKKDENFKDALLQLNRNRR